jgi:hypothetical protein
MASVSFDINAVDKASSVLYKIQDILTQTGGKAGMVAGAFIGMGVAVAGALSKAVSEAQDYDQQIKGLMVSTGASADQTSRMVQVLDDAGIEFNTVTKAMKEMAKDGTEPSIEEIASLSDEFLKLQTGAERGQFLLDKFGKSGLDMARAMALGGDEIRKMNSEMEGGLILTEENIASSEEYRKNLDNLSDSVRGLKTALGNELIPSLSRASDMTIDLLDNANDLSEKGFGYGEGKLNAFSLAMDFMAQRVAKGKEEQYAMRDAVNAHADALDGTLTPAIIAASDATVAYERNNQDFLSTIGTMQSAETSYNDNVKSLAEERIQIETDRATAISQGWWEGSEKIKEFDAALVENTLKSQENATQHELDSRKIMFGLMQQQMAMDGLDATETATLQRLGVQWGIFSQTVVNESQRAISYAEGIAKAINNIKDKTVRITVIQEGAAASNISYELGTQLGYRTGGKQKNAGGGSYVIPKSFGNEGFNMGGLGTASGGERVSISQNGQQQNAAPAMDMKLLARTIVTAMQQAGT